MRLNWPTLVTACDFIATFAFALVGSRVAASRNMDIGGIALVAAVASLAGGTFRNLFLLQTPPWIQNGWLILPVLIGGVTGGLLRDLFAQLPPVLLHRETIGSSCLA